jgi:hypothetical protein
MAGNKCQTCKAQGSHKLKETRLSAALPHSASSTPKAWSRVEIILNPQEQPVGKTKCNQ